MVSSVCAAVCFTFVCVRACAGRLLVRLNNGEEDEYDTVLCATGEELFKCDEYIISVYMSLE